jgi:hypothetical protein
MMTWPSWLGVEVGEGGDGHGTRQWGLPPLRALGRSDTLILRSGTANLGS